MSTLNTTVLAFRAKPAQSAAFLDTLLLRLPEELVLEVLGYVVTLPGSIAKAEFEDGVCDWPSCRCQNGIWKHVPMEILTSRTLDHLLMKAAEPIPRLAELAFYSTNIFHICGPQYDPKPVRNVTLLPPPGVRHWIRHLEITIEIGLPGEDSLPSTFGIVPKRDWDFLRRLQQGSHGFTGLRSLKLMFESLLIWKKELRMLETELAKVEPFCFQTQKLAVEACSADWNEDEDDSWTGSISPNDPLRRLLEKFMVASGKKGAS